MSGLKDLTDRELLVRIATKQEGLESTMISGFERADKEVVKLEDEDATLHHRINEVHGRVNSIKFWSAGFAAIGSILGSFVGYITRR